MAMMFVTGAVALVLLILLILAWVETSTIAPVPMLIVSCRKICPLVWSGLADDHHTVIVLSRGRIAPGVWNVKRLRPRLWCVSR